MIHRIELGESPPRALGAAIIVEPSEREMRKPALPRVWAMTGDEYASFLCSHVHRGRSIVLVGGALEYATLSRWWVNLVTWGLALSLSLLWIARSCHWLAASALFAGGWLAWTLLEYSIHRWVFHLEHWWRLPSRLVGLRNVIHFTVHGVHHKYPGDPARTVTPLLMSAFVALPVYGILRAAMDRTLADPLTCGMVAGWLFYDYVHHACHMAPDARWPLNTEWLGRMRKRHLNHHYRNDARAYGVSTTAVDALFGTDSVF